MQIQNLHIENFRLLKNIDLSFSNGINLLIGDNGMGKSSILDAISIGLYDIVSKYQVTKCDFLMDYISIGEKASTISMNVLGIDEKIYHTTKLKCRDKSAKEFINALSNEKISDISYPSLSSYLENNVDYPIISFQCIKKGTDDLKFKQYLDKDGAYLGYARCLNGRANVRMVTKWYELNIGTTAADIFLSIVKRFMRQMLDSYLDVEYKDNKFVVFINNKTLPLSSMSSGFQTIMQIVMDLAFRIAVLHPHMPSFDKVKGIVLIDEIELHLHPKWQWKILNALVGTLPQVQFIISTHSPMVISSCKKCNLILLGKNENNEIECISQSPHGLYGKSIEDVVQYNMGSRNIPEDLYRMYEEFHRLYSSSQYQEAELQLKKMQELYGSENGTVKSAEFMLNLTFDDEF